MNIFCKSHGSLITSKNMYFQAIKDEPKNKKKTTTPCKELPHSVVRRLNTGGTLRIEIACCCNARPKSARKTTYCKLSPVKKSIVFIKPWRKMC